MSFHLARTARGPDALRRACVGASVDIPELVVYAVSSANSSATVGNNSASSRRHIQTQSGRGGGNGGGDNTHSACTRTQYGITHQKFFGKPSTSMNHAWNTDPGIIIVIIIIWIESTISTSPHRVAWGVHVVREYIEMGGVYHCRMHWIAFGRNNLSEFFSLLSLFVRRSSRIIDI